MKLVRSEYESIKFHQKTVTDIVNYFKALLSYLVITINYQVRFILILIHKEEIHLVYKQTIHHAVTCSIAVSVSPLTDVRPGMGKVK